MKKISLATILMMSATACTVTGTAMAQPSQSQSQFITKSGSQPSAVGSADYFTGHVRIDPVFGDKGEAAPFGAGYVTFAPGARSFWHTHPTGQHLVVTHGMGWTGTTDGVKEEIKAGDVVWCPPGVKHWHGATATTGMTHLAITGVKNGQNVEWLEAVTDEQYNK